ncbi:hypothetical protein BCR44DRAFT_1453071, partial [Catenaria anguillulae PL171]
LRQPGCSLRHPAFLRADSFTNLVAQARVTEVLVALNDSSHRSIPLKASLCHLQYHLCLPFSPLAHPQPINTRHSKCWLGNLVPLLHHLRLSIPDPLSLFLCSSPNVDTLVFPCNADTGSATTRHPSPRCTDRLGCTNGCVRHRAAILTPPPSSRNSRTNLSRSSARPTHLHLTTSRSSTRSKRGSQLCSSATRPPSMSTYHHPSGPSPYP